VVSPGFCAAGQCKKKKMQQSPEKRRRQEAAAAKNLHAFLRPLSLSLFLESDLSATASMASLYLSVYLYKLFLCLGAVASWVY
jgi:hypothetical protein